MRRALAFLLFAALAHAEQVNVTVLATTDLHGNLYPIDYYTDSPAPRGLAKIATLIRAAEAESPNHILIDCGDTIQGSPLEFVHQEMVRKGSALGGDPMMLAMNRLGYDAMTVGNHEFNFGLTNLNRARSDATFPWISANIAVARGGKERSFAPYIVKIVGGVKVAVIGITTPVVPIWEKPENLGSYRFLPAAEAVREIITKLRRSERPDLIIAAVHAGLGPDPAHEHVSREIAERNPELAAIVFGHSHREVEGLTVGGVLLVQPKNWGMSLARLDFKLERKPSGRWSIAAKKSALVRVTDETPAAPDILEIARPYHEAAERHLEQPVTTSPVALESALGRVEDTPLVDAVQNVQLAAGKADVSFTALFNPSVRVPQGKVTVRQIAALYPYDNELYVVEGSGKMVKDALENAARYYLSCQGERCTQSPLINSDVIGFNYDMAEGVEYEIDLTRPVGDRIHNLRWHGKALAPDQTLRVAINNYRAGGSAGYSMFVGAKLLWHSQAEIRQMLVEYYADGRSLPAKAAGNWRVIPEAARITLEKEAMAESRRQQLQ